MICQIEFWGDFPTWVQAICAIATLLLSGIVWYQGNRITELAEIAEQQTNQTQILSEMLNQTIFEHFQRTAPKFEVAARQFSGLRHMTFQLRLLNSHAILQSFQTVPSGFVTVNSNAIGLTVNPGKMIDLNLGLTATGNTPNRFDLFINYSNDDGQSFVQRGILRIENNLEIKLHLLSIRQLDLANQ